MKTVHNWGVFMCPELANQNGHRRSIKGNCVGNAEDNLLRELEKRLGNMYESIKGLNEYGLKTMK